MPKKEPSRMVEQKSGPVGIQKTSFDAARSAFDKAKDAVDELKGAVAYLDRGPEDFLADDAEEELDSKYGKYRDVDTEELKKRLNEAEAAQKEAKGELRESAIEEARSELENSQDLTQEQYEQAQQSTDTAKKELRAATKKQQDMEKTEEQFLEEYRMPHSKSKDQAGIKSEYESSVESSRNRLKADSAALEKAKQSYDELKKLRGNVFTRLMNSSKIKELEEQMNLPVFEGDPDKMLEQFNQTVERTKQFIKSEEARLAKLNAHIETGAFAGRTPEYEAGINAVKAQIEDASLKQMQSQKQLREMEAAQSKLSTLIDVLELPASKNLDEQKRILSDFLAKQ